MAKHGDFRQRRNSLRVVRKLTFARRIFVFCEGANTERDYLSGLVTTRGNKLVELVFMGAQGAPTTILEAAKRKQLELSKHQRKSKDSFDSAFDVWVAFDVDNCSNGTISTTKKNAKDFGIKVACSNPCFELWLVYHFEDFNKLVSHTEIQKYATKIINSYDYKGSKEIDFKEFSGAVELAVERGLKGLESRLAEGKEEGCPSTTFVHLVIDILRFGKPTKLSK
jgi:hypothetical protein